MLKESVTWWTLRLCLRGVGGWPGLCCRGCQCLCCRDCFKALYVHKFRAMLGKSRLIFPGEKVGCGAPLAGGPSQPHRASPSYGRTPGLLGDSRLETSLGGVGGHVGGAVPPVMFLLPQVLLAWSGGPSSSSMVWQVLEVCLHTILLPRLARIQCGGLTPRDSCLGLERKVLFPARMLGAPRCGHVDAGPGVVWGVPSHVWV